MRRLIKETIRNFRQSLITNTILMIQLSICFWMICMLCNSFFDMGFKKYYKDDIKDNKIFYQSAFYQAPLIFNDLTIDNRALENTKDYILQLRNQEEFIYTKYNAAQDFTIKKEELEKFKLSIEDISKFITYPSTDLNKANLASIQMDKLGFEYFNLNIFDGRAFEDSDFILDSKLEQLPIILGYMYKDIFKVGDMIRYTYCGKQFEGEVVGILNNDNNIFSGGTSAINLDDKVILPLPDFNYIPEDYEERSFQSLVYMDILNGANIITDVNSNNIEITRKIYDLCNRYDFMKYEPSITATTNGLAMFKGESEQALKIIFIMIIIMNIFCIFTFVMNIYNKIENNMRRYLIQILQGASIRHILATYLLEVFIIIVLSLCASCYLLRKEITVSYTFLLLLGALASIVAAITCITIAYRLKNLDSDKLLRRE